MLELRSPTHLPPLLQSKRVGWGASTEEQEEEEDIRRDIGSTEQAGEGDANQAGYHFTVTKREKGKEDHVKKLQLRILLDNDETYTGKNRKQRGRKKTHRVWEHGGQRHHVDDAVASMLLGFSLFSAGGAADSGGEDECC